MDRPKRRKSKDNPYTLITNNNRYFVIFSDVNNKKNIVEVSEQVFYTFDKFELEDKKELNEYDRHIEHSEIYDETLLKRTSLLDSSIEDKIVEKYTYNGLINAINSLPTAIKRRMILFYFDELSTSEIAIIDNCSDRMVRKSLERGRELIKDYFEKNKLI